MDRKVIRLFAELRSTSRLVRKAEVVQLFNQYLAIALKVDVKNPPAYDRLSLAIWAEELVTRRVPLTFSFCEQWVRLDCRMMVGEKWGVLSALLYNDDPVLRVEGDPEAIALARCIDSWWTKDQTLSPESHRDGIMSFLV